MRVDACAPDRRGPPTSQVTLSFRLGALGPLAAAACAPLRGWGPPITCETDPPQPAGRDRCSGRRVSASPSASSIWAWLRLRAPARFAAARLVPPSLAPAKL